MSIDHIAKRHCREDRQGANQLKTLKLYGFDVDELSDRSEDDTRADNEEYNVICDLGGLDDEVRAGLNAIEVSHKDESKDIWFHGNDLNWCSIVKGLNGVDEVPNLVYSVV